MMINPAIHTQAAQAPLLASQQFGALLTFVREWLHDTCEPLRADACGRYLAEAKDHADLERRRDAWAAHEAQLRRLKQLG
jgi:hypothetical protein